MYQGRAPFCPSASWLLPPMSSSALPDAALANSTRRARSRAVPLAMPPRSMHSGRVADTVWPSKRTSASVPWRARSAWISAAGRRSGRGGQRLLAVELPQPDQRADAGVEAPAARRVQVDGAGDQRREVGADRGRLALREQGIHPRQFAGAEGVPVPFGHSKQALDRHWRPPQRPGPVRIEDLDADVGAEGRKAVSVTAGCARRRPGPASGQQRRRRHAGRSGALGPARPPGP